MDMIMQQLKNTSQMTYQEQGLAGYKKKLKSTWNRFLEKF